MMRTSMLIAAVAALAGCDGGTQTIQFEGDDLARYFPFEGDRTWEYKADDTTTPYLLVAQTAENSELLDAARTRVYTVDFRYKCVSNLDPCLEDLDEGLTRRPGRR